MTSAENEPVQLENQSRKLLDCEKRLEEQAAKQEKVNELRMWEGEEARREIMSLKRELKEKAEELRSSELRLELEVKAQNELMLRTTDEHQRELAEARKTLIDQHAAINMQRRMDGAKDGNTARQVVELQGTVNLLRSALKEQEMQTKQAQEEVLALKPHCEARKIQEENMKNVIRQLTAHKQWADSEINKYKQVVPVKLWILF